MNTIRKATLAVSLTLFVTAHLVPAMGADNGTPDVRPILTPTLGHSVISAYSMDVSRDGTLMVTGGADYSTALWDVATGAELRRFVGHTDIVQATALSPYGKRVLTTSLDGTTRLWDTATGAELRRLEAGRGRSIAFSPDGTSIISGGLLTTFPQMKGGLILWDAATGLIQRRFATRSSIQSVAFSPDGRTVLAGTSGGAVTLWDVATGEEQRRFLGHSKSVSSVAYSPDGATVLTGSDDQTARLWDLTTGEELLRLPDHPSSIRIVAFSHDGRTVATLAKLTARLWDIETGEELSQFRGAVSVAFLPDPRFLLVNTMDMTRLMDVETGAEIREIKGYGRWAGIEGGMVAYSSDGTSILIPGSTGVAVWDTATGVEKRRFGPGTKSVVLSPDSRTMLIRHLREEHQLWDLTTGRELLRLSNSGGVVGGAAFSHDGRTVLVAGGYGAGLWDVATGELLRSFEGHTDTVEAVAFSADSRRVLTGSWDGTARLWDAETGEELQQFEKPDGRKSIAGLVNINVVALSPDGLYAITGHWNGNLRFLDLATGLETLASSYDNSLEVERATIEVIAFSKEGRYALTARIDGTIQIWDPTSRPMLRNGLVQLPWKNLLTVNVDVGRLRDASFSADGRFILVSGNASGVKLLDSATGIELAELHSFNDGTWAVVDPAGRFDASDGGDIQGLHWVVGLEPIKLSQLKDRYYEPGLLAKILGFNTEPIRDVAAFSNVALYPDVSLEASGADSSSFNIKLHSRGGGIGRVVVSIDGKEVAADARGDGFDDSAGEALIAVDIADHPSVTPGVDNTLEVKVYNTEGYVVSRGKTVRWRAPGAEISEPAELWAVIAGVSDYSGDKLDLKFAAKDAVDFAAALEPSAKLLFGADNVHITLLSTEDDSTGLPPTRANLVLALQKLTNAKPTDVVLVYLAGHAVTDGDQDSDYYFLTQQATSFDLNDVTVRSAVALSGDELTELMLKIPVAKKQVLILDTCGAGRVLERLAQPRGVPSSQTRALDKMKDRAGLYMLAGAAADKDSYESSVFGHGLLTYSLLEGMSGVGPLRDDEFLDVSLWFGYAAERVPEIAAGLGGVQRPLNDMRMERFDIAWMTKTEQGKIHLNPRRPSVIRADFGLKGSRSHKLGLQRAVNAALRDAESRGAEAPWVFFDTEEYARGYKLSGSYTESAATDVVVVDVYLLIDNETVATKTVAGTSTRLDLLVDDILAFTEEFLDKDEGGSL